MKKKQLWLFVFISLVILIGVFYYMQYASNAKKEEIVRTGIPIGKEYIKEYYRADFIFKSYDYIGSYVNNTIYLIGYIKGHEDHSISIAYDFEKKEVLDVLGPAWFIDSRNPKKN
ncbi:MULTISPECIES: hypothetical protein [Paenibacillus]|uniref:hypothetical protein n=1 Tax=Paenibacillus TaxID=44249 RepID=UPI0003D3A008|nr:MULTISPECIES: hypothetical protein [Paenibacillus]AIW42133.1 hypothetical protein X809_40500 [Paenibacillus polymyxa CR1]MBP1173574.1 hypothetical protein [Paenibacillus sp. PvR133]